MTNDETPNPTEVSSEQREAVRKRAQAVNARITAKKIARRVIVTLLIAAVVVAGAWWVWQQVAPELDNEVQVPQNFTSTDGIDVIALAAGEPVDERESTPADGVLDIDVYIDYLAPEAGAFETEVAPHIYERIEDGTVTLTYHPIAMMTGQAQGTQYSKRAGSAVACVVTLDPATFPAFNTSLLEQQPAPDSEGYSDEQLSQLAIDAGAAENSGVRECIEERRYASWITEATERARDGAVPGTDDVQLTSPFLLTVDGQAYAGSPDDPAELQQFLLLVESEQYFAPTPMPDADDTDTPADSSNEDDTE
ncbi:thioredoxin domain-containing protein [Microbacterium amylolyticum]|uniref:Thioredoxin-like fold domain-containing protein n=1 Tax=Microbacterium amylolyticum TaxID=936337 RepID=A0ABS4ZIV2_9MICO|nr:thioredoxin domain-containing protein [Microbacterium amylolyticum]MBP2437210.1 hypothetical protein [Microbacterium amylolyticum]